MIIAVYLRVIYVMPLVAENGLQHPTDVRIYIYVCILLSVF